MSRTGGPESTPEAAVSKDHAEQPSTGPTFTVSSKKKNEGQLMFDF